MTDDVVRNPLEWLVKGFSVLTASMFVASGMANVVLFVLNWRLNYFMIASPADVIMSAFYWGTLSVLTAVAVGLAVKFVVPRVYVWADRKIARLFRQPDDGPTIWDRWTGMHWFVYGVVVALGTMIIFVGHAAANGQSYWYESGLKVANGVLINNEPCDGGSVEWIGSSSAILKCSGKIVVIHKLDDLVTVQKYPEH